MDRLPGERVEPAFGYIARRVRRRLDHDRCPEHGRRYAATFRCVLGAPGLYVERGVWWRSLTFVPRARVQHTDVDQGPLARRFGLATLKVFTAGSEHSENQIEELRHADALRLRDDLLERHERSA